MLSSLYWHDRYTHTHTHARAAFSSSTRSIDTEKYPGDLDGKESACNVGVPGSIPGSGKSPRGGNGNPLQYSCLENSMDCIVLLLLLLLSHFSRVLLFETSWTVTCQAPLSMGFSRQEYWIILLFPSPGDFPDPGIEPGSPTLQADSLLSGPLSMWAWY